MVDGQIFTIALIGGIMPALVWLTFWLREDKEHPEPRGALFLTFLSGMIAVPLILPIQKAICATTSPSECMVTETAGILTIILLAVVEEIIKFFSAYVTAIRTRICDEPIDALIYMITAALGFSAAENTLFLINPLIYESISTSIVTGNLRFIGASLLHLASSATIGIFLAFTFYKSRLYKFGFLIIGIFFAIVLHTSFNLFIMNESNTGKFLTFSGVWLAIIVLLAIFEKIKHLRSKKPGGQT